MFEQRTFDQIRDKASGSNSNEHDMKFVLQVRIEDDVVITADGVELMTQVPRTVEEIEALMSEGRR